MLTGHDRLQTHLCLTNGGSRPILTETGGQRPIPADTWGPSRGPREPRAAASCRALVLTGESSHGTRCNFPPLLPTRRDPTSAQRTRLPGMPGAWFTPACPSLPANSNPLTLKTNGNDTAPPQRAFQKALGVTHRTKDPQPQPASQRGCSPRALLYADDKGTSFGSLMTGHG